MAPSAAKHPTNASSRRPRPRCNRATAVAHLEDIAANGLPAVEDCTPWEELREAHLARLAAQRPAVA
ncbi:hypothetical protein [Streptomyces roseus]|uniref:hypothetical protein n=1 Tax=Streptomyces roseus TaxID=66430 RepID=UPI00099CEF3C|nr:hypothetical protein [Streptomyces roseus]